MKPGPKVVDLEEGHREGKGREKGSEGGREGEEKSLRRAFQ
jgi:hypothetical protein